MKEIKEKTEGQKTTEYKITIIAVMFSLVAATIMLVLPGHKLETGMISAEQWIEVVKWVPTVMGGLYGAGRVGLKAIEKAKQ